MAGTLVPCNAHISSLIPCCGHLGSFPAYNRQRQVLLGRLAGSVAALQPAQRCCLPRAARGSLRCEAAKGSRRQGESAADQRQTAETAQQQVAEHQQQRRQEQQEQSGNQRQEPGITVQQQQQQQSLYEGRFGLPIVQRYLRYEELLREIRSEKVEEILFFSQRGSLDLEGVCLVSYKDGSVAQSVVPDYDYRIPYAMETHGVTTSRLRTTPTISELTPNTPPSQQVQKVFTTWLPLIGIVVVWAAAQLAARIKGDLEDRQKLRKADRDRLKAMEDEADVDLRLTLADDLADMGLSAQQIMKKLDKEGVPYQPDAINALVEEAMKKREREGDVSGPTEFFNDQAKDQAAYNEEMKRKAAEEEGQQDQMEEATQMLKMATARLVKAVDPEEEKLRIKMRKAKRKMKGVNLQYVADRRVFFDDVAGIGEAKVELQEVVDFFTKPQLFRKSGARIPRGVLLCGPPGTGKTLLARAVAGESGVAFLSLNASEFVEMFVGVGAARVRDLFNQARSLRPCIIFMDEIDAVGRTRGGAQGNDERDTTLNQLLSEMDGFGDGGETGVIVMAATNRKDVLDPALIRPGRFDRIIHVGAPNFDGRMEILEVHLRDRPREENIDLREVAVETEGFTGAQLANLVNTAGGFVAKAGRESLTAADLLYALSWERKGPQRPPASPERRKRVAVQEGATALVATLLPAIEPVKTVTIAPYQKLPLGHLVLEHNEGRELNNMFTRRYLEEQLRMVLAGRAAEELVYGVEDMSTINQRSLNMARRICQKLVVSGGLNDSPELGPTVLSLPIERDGNTAQIVPSWVTAATHQQADRLMDGMLSQAYDDVKATLVRNRGALDAMIDALLDRTSMVGDEVRELVEQHAAQEDLRFRTEEQAAFL